MNVIIVTNRLLLRTFTINDAQLIYDLNKDEDVTRYTYDPIIDPEQARDVLEKVILPQYVLYNHGRWAVHLKADLDPIAIGFIGWCGLKYRPERNEVDLGYRFKRSAWNKGYATEAAYACLKYGFEKLNIPKITGRAVPENAGSWRVLEKIGMQFTREESVDGHWARTYELSNPSIP
jgi:RimJ/RimL family protein N-acetyltransferase